MAETKYGKYIISEPKPKGKTAPWAAPHGPDEVTSIAGMDDDSVKGAFFVVCNWWWPRNQVTCAKDKVYQPHKHDYNQVLLFLGTNPKDPHDLGGETEIYLGDEMEKHTITKSSILFIPKGLMHLPKSIRKDKPIISVNIVTGKKYY